MPVKRETATQPVQTLHFVLIRLPIACLYVFRPVASMVTCTTRIPTRIPWNFSVAVTATRNVCVAEPDTWLLTALQPCFDLLAGYRLLSLFLPLSLMNLIDLHRVCSVAWGQRAARIHSPKCQNKENKENKNSRPCQMPGIFCRHLSCHSPVRRLPWGAPRCDFLI